MRARKNGVRGAGAFKIRCGELARSRESDWLYLVKILIQGPASMHAQAKCVPPVWIPKAAARTAAPQKKFRALLGQGCYDFPKSKLPFVYCGRGG